MAKTHLTRHIKHTPEELMALVGNVEAYPEFINLISALRVKNRAEIAAGHERFEAEATVSYKFISESFGSVVDLYHDEKRIRVSKADRSGAVKALQNDWTFHELSDGTTLVDFKVDVKLKAFPLELLLRDKFNKAGNHMMNLFEVKASQTCKKLGDPNLSLPAECQRLGLMDLLPEQT